MKYKMVSWADHGTPKENAGDTSIFQISVIVGIIGDTYGFIAPYPLKNITDVIVPNKLQLDLDELKEFKEDAAITFVMQNYPDTP